MIDPKFDHPFRDRATRILNSGQSQSIVLSGNVHDLFYRPGATEDDKGEYVGLTEYLINKWGKENVIPIVYEPNRFIRFRTEADKKKMRDAWIASQSGVDANVLAVQQLLASDEDRKKLEEPGLVFDRALAKCVERPAVALQLLSMFCQISNKSKPGDPLEKSRLIIIIEWADMLIPESDIARLSEIDRFRLSIFQDWFSDPSFAHGRDAVVLLTESASLMNSRVTSLPQVMKIDVPAPDENARRHFIEWFEAAKVSGILPLWDTKDTLSKFTAGLNLQALSQLMKGAIFSKTPITLNDVIERVKIYIESQLGEGVVEFKQPQHRLEDVIGNRKLKAYLADELMDRIQATDESAVTGIGVPGPIGGGKTYCFEAIAAKLGMPVLVLKNIRSQWFGQTDVIMEKLGRILYSLQKAMIFIDEADTAFGGVGEGTHETERRLTGRMQGFMSDPLLRGKIIFLLITARFDKLSPDMRRDERLSVIAPVFDPDGEDRHDFIVWMLKSVMDTIPERDSDAYKQIEHATVGFSAAAFKALRSELKALKKRKPSATLEEILAVIRNKLSPNIGKTRRLQTLVAYVNCSRLDLLPNPESYEKDLPIWHEEIRRLEAEGIR